jgi:ubiquinone/menaquinone biosynthesis C-methylase UbiE
MSAAAAVAELRRDPQQRGLIEESYLDENLESATKRFLKSDEARAITDVLGDRLRGARVLDVGAGRGLSSLLSAQRGASLVCAVEPDPDPDIGYGALRQVRGQLPIRILAGVGEGIPLRTASMSIAYVRQALHHARDLFAYLREIARVLEPGGLFLGTREHVAETGEALEQFLADHVLHRLTGGEAAYPLAHYERAIRSSGMRLTKTWGPWDSVINAFPAVQNEQELRDLRERWIDTRLGALKRFRVMRIVAWHFLKRPYPGALYSFLAVRLP